MTTSPKMMVDVIDHLVGALGQVEGSQPSSTIAEVQEEGEGDSSRLPKRAWVDDSCLQLLGRLVMKLVEREGNGGRWKDPLAHEEEHAPGLNDKTTRNTLTVQRERIGDEKGRYGGKY
ncbi:uncharacterized protein G2W53_003971 [Senna tora]|uniref:Uncharacterized protein n=1 Tax=Senna tora TaxID=362788 RepID=A0A834X9L8_9FABA|nr:uncharacterized protein G2W53_003971 [Senna tora]